MANPIELHFAKDVSESRDEALSAADMTANMARRRGRDYVMLGEDVILRDKDTSDEAWKKNMESLSRDPEFNHATVDGKTILRRNDGVGRLTRAEDTPGVVEPVAFVDGDVAPLDESDPVGDFASATAVARGALSGNGGAQPAMEVSGDGTVIRPTAWDKVVGRVSGINDAIRDTVLDDGSAFDKARMGEEAARAAAASPPPPEPGAPELTPELTPEQQQAEAFRAAMAAKGGIGGDAPQFKGAEVPQDLIDHAKAMHDTADAMIPRITESVQANAKHVADAADQLAIEHARAEEAMATSAELAQKAKLNSLANADRAQSAFQATMEKARQVASTAIDPHRYFNDQNIAQKAFTVLAGFCFGFTGQGMDFLKRLDSLVAEDNRLQQSDREMKVAGLKDAAEGFKNARDYALSRGATEAEAHQINRAAVYQAFQMRAEQFARESSNAQVQQQSMMAAHALAQAGAQSADAVMSHAQAKAESENKVMYENAQLRMEQRKLNAETQWKLASAAKGAGQKMNQDIVKDLAAMKVGIHLADTLTDLIGNPEGALSTAAKDALMSLFPGTGATTRQQGVELAYPLIWEAIQRSSRAPNKHMFEVLNKAKSGVGFASLSQGDVDFLKKELRAGYNEKLEEQMLGGADVGGRTLFPEDSSGPKTTKMRTKDGRIIEVSQ